MNVSIVNKQTFFSFDEASSIFLVQAVLEAEGVICDEVSITFLDAGEIANLHGEFFDDPTPTDCISFPLDSDDDSGYRILGDVFVCPRVAYDYVEANDGDVYEEVALYIIHGLLHLIGYDDIEEKDIKDMRAAEERCAIAVKDAGISLRHKKKYSGM
jgi:probable rRNA maturation factor